MKTKLMSLALACFMLTGCSSLFSQPDIEQQVEQRVNEMMTAFIVKDYKKAYAYMSPGYKETHKLQRFYSDFAGLADVVEYSIRELDCLEDTRCEVTVVRQQKAPTNILGTSKKPMLVPVNHKQTWIQVKGKWFYYKR